MKTFYAVAALLVGSPALAQVDSSRTLNEVVISANKYPTKTSSTGKVVVVINRADIERAGSRDLSQLLNEQGGLYINGAASNPGKDKSIYLRGARVEHTLITIDGVPVYDATGIGSNFDLRQIPIESVERIEVLKGSQSTLYGSDAIAGVINIITRKGSGQSAGGNGLLSYGSYRTVRAAAAIHGGKKAFDYNIGYNYFSTNGISEAQKPAGATGTFDKDGSEQNGVQASFGIQAAPRIRIAPYIRYARVNGELDNDALVDDPDYTYTNKNLQTGVRNEIGIGSGTLSLLYQLTNTKRDYRDDSSLGMAFSTNRYRANEHFAEAIFVQSFSSLKLTAGADFRSSSLDLNTYYNGFGFVSKSELGTDSTQQDQAGLYAALAYNGGSGFSVEGGARLNHHSRYGSNLAYNLNPSFLFRKQWKVFANLSSGYRTPSLYQLYSEYGNRALDPEVSLNIEGGVQYFTSDEKAYLRATYFRRDVNDLMVFFFDPVTFQSRYINRDKQEDHGIEVDGKINLNERIQIKAFYSYVNGKITTQQGGKDTTFFNLYRRPKQSFALTIGTQATKALYLSAQLNSVGRSLDLTFPPPTYSQTQVELKPYVLVNLYGEYAFPKTKVRLFADVRNVTGEAYHEVYGYNTPGVNAYGGIRFNF
ncbi:MAG: TonB-dependent receptor [Flaviaesturariibacter sp.]|nr:TonB-dependent receptor [Flaviaesturariibacter sp.]